MIKKNIKNIKKIIGITFLNLFVFNTVKAQTISFPNPIEQQSIEALVNKILEVVVDMGAIVVIFFLVYSGYLFVKAQGNPGEIESAKKTFFWTIVGGLVVLGAFVISEVIVNTVNEIKG